MQSVLILQMDGFEAIEKFEDRAGATMYVDPPYWGVRERYQHMFVEEAAVEEALPCGGVEPGRRNDHVRLARLLNRFQQTRVVLRYYRAPRLDVLYPGWHREYPNLPKSLSCGTKRGRCQIRSPEVLLVNAPAAGTIDEPAADLFGAVG